MEVSTSDPKVRAAAVRHEKGTWPVAIVNRNERETAVSVALPDKVATPWRKYEYLVASPPRTEDGDLPGPVGRVKTLKDKVKPLSLTNYTTAYADAAPAPVTGLKTERFHDTRLPGAFAWAQRVTWKQSASNDVVYYRVFYGDQRAGSTATTEFIDEDSQR